VIRTIAQALVAVAALMLVYADVQRVDDINQARADMARRAAEANQKLGIASRAPVLDWQ
jgi:cell division protein ZapA (FtsZ GTPase activity inhibitor)